MSWGCCLGFAVLAFLFEYVICGGLTQRSAIAVSDRSEAKVKQKMPR